MRWRKDETKSRRGKTRRMKWREKTSRRKTGNATRRQRGKATQGREVTSRRRTGELTRGMGGTTKRTGKDRGGHNGKDLNTTAVI